MKSSFFERNVPRPMPKFSREEIGLGKLLGIGGFCRVHEVVAISLPVVEDKNYNAVEELRSLNGKGVGGCEDEDNEEDTVNVNGIDSEDESVKSMIEFDEVQARTYMQKHCMREDYAGEMNARYAIKRLKSTLKGGSVSRGTDDLAVEAKFLAAIEHPNIIKMRAVANVEPTDPGFYILLDRLFETLEERIYGEWTNVHKLFGKKVSKELCCCCMSVKPINVEIRILWFERLIAAYDLSSAFRYIHKNRIVYRDIKPENIGFDVRGDVKLFDFGFAREMLPKDRVAGTNCYNLTALTGSMRYMAPEVALKKPYNEKADVYSFGILLYEIVALAPSFDIENIGDHFHIVCKGGLRPKTKSDWPILVANLMKECWSEDVKRRPNFVQIANILRGQALVFRGNAGNDIINRTNVMLNKSNSSRMGHFEELDMEIP